MCRPLQWLWGLIPVCFLVVIAYFFVTPQVENEISLKTAEALSAAGQSWAVVSVKGRDVLLTGTAPTGDALEAAVDAAATADGVRRVSHDVIIRVAPVN